MNHRHPHQDHAGAPQTQTLIIYQIDAASSVMRWRRAHGGRRRSARPCPAGPLRAPHRGSGHLAWSRRGKGKGTRIPLMSGSPLGKHIWTTWWPRNWEERWGGGVTVPRGQESWQRGSLRGDAQREPASTQNWYLRTPPRSGARSSPEEAS